MNQPPLEAMLEAVLRQNVRLRGGLTYKLAPTVKGMPDRLVLFPMGRIYLVELKTEKGTLSPAQIEWHKSAAKLGTRVVTLYGAQQIREWVRSCVAMFDEDECTQPQSRAQNNRRWTALEDEAVLAADRPSDVVLAERLGRTVSAVGQRRHNLNQLAIIRDNAEG